MLDITPYAEEHVAAVRQKLRPGVCVLTMVSIGRRQSLGFASCRRDLNQAT